ncbi:hypothetical protein LTR08_002441 [Meristemomyces frigidus]|nr:hypothetical protein LTR08_002441 [Meristemomyces frigidus]
MARLQSATLQPFNPRTVIQMEMINECPTMLANKTSYESIATSNPQAVPDQVKQMLTDEADKLNAYEEVLIRREVAVAYREFQLASQNAEIDSIKKVTLAMTKLLNNKDTARKEVQEELDGIKQENLALHAKLDCREIEKENTEMVFKEALAEKTLLASAFKHEFHSLLAEKHAGQTGVAVTAGTGSLRGV